MKNRLRACLCFMIAVSMVFSMIPAAQADGAGFKEELQTVQEEPQTVQEELRTVQGQAKIVSPDDPIEDGLHLQDGHYVLYINGMQVTDTGWKKISTGRYYVGKNDYVTAKMEEKNGIFRYYDFNSGTGKWVILKDAWKTVEGKEYYFNKSGRCTRIYDRDTEKCRKYDDGKMIAVKMDVCRLRNGKLYYFDSRGIRVTKKGWKKASSKKYIQIRATGYVMAKMENTKGLWKYYIYNYKKNVWQKQKNVWKSVNGIRYYFNKSGKCTKFYNTKTGKCHRYEKGKMRVVKKDICRLKNGKLYYFDSRGIRVTKKGWKKASSKKYFQVGKSGGVSAKMQNTKGTWRYSKYDYHKNKWIRQKNVWITVDKKKYYFAGTGKCTRMYNTVTRKCYDYKNGRGELIKNDVRKVEGKEFYFGANGVRVKEAGMYLTSQNILIYANEN